MFLQAHRAHVSQLPCQVVAAVPRQQADEAAAAAGVDPRRHSPFISYAMIAAAEVGKHRNHAQPACGKHRPAGCDMTTACCKSCVRWWDTCCGPQRQAGHRLDKLHAIPAVCSPVLCHAAVLHHAMLCLPQALADAQWRPNTPQQQAGTGVSIGAGMSCTSKIAEAGALIAAAKLRRVSPYFVPRILVNMAAGAVSISHQLRGPNHAVSTACATGVHCIGDAFRMVQRGDADVMVAGELWGAVFAEKYVCIDSHSLHAQAYPQRSQAVTAPYLTTAATWCRRCMIAPFLSCSECHPTCLSAGSRLYGAWCALHVPFIRCHLHGHVRTFNSSYPTHPALPVSAQVLQRHA